MKFSPHKVTLPSKKQVFRFYEDGKIKKDIVCSFDERMEGEPLLKEYMKEGKIVKNLPKLEEIKEKAINNLEKLPEELKDINKTVHFLPEISPKLQKLVNEIKEKI